jgi:hypothetical protein
VSEFVGRVEAEDQRATETTAGDVLDAGVDLFLHKRGNLNMEKLWHSAAGCPILWS